MSGGDWLSWLCTKRWVISSTEKLIFLQCSFLFLPLMTYLARKKLFLFVWLQVVWVFLIFESSEAFPLAISFSSNYVMAGYFWGDSGSQSCWHLPGCSSLWLFTDRVVAFFCSSHPAPLQEKPCCGAEVIPEPWILRYLSILGDRIGQIDQKLY